ncbi:hypothetical protein [Rossellomorea sp. DA94]|uniref:hypothetical protein n=1 Tax=Rossellomorea sp. DA94 TaxID=3038653 RepID=UPI002449265F|nr:hypothetical protein [Rossellomorea sp. DA94]WGG46393.1 hypothetical protein P8596_03965 [Rossellomorea sp. DA94]
MNLAVREEPKSRSVIQSENLWYNFFDAGIYDHFFPWSRPLSGIHDEGSMAQCRKSLSGDGSGGIIRALLSSIPFVSEHGNPILQKRKGE